MLILLLLALSAVANLSDCRQVCYDKYGCFTDEYPFSGSLQRPLAFLPEEPAKINTTFILYNRKEKNGKYVDVATIQKSFMSSTATKFLVHGYTNDAYITWVQSMKDEFLKSGQMNVIAVDWNQGAANLYTQAVINDL